MPGVPKSFIRGGNTFGSSKFWILCAVYTWLNLYYQFLGGTSKFAKESRISQYFVSNVNAPEICYLIVYKFLGY